MSSQIFFDDILHAFESDSNLHLVLGAVSGRVDEAGNDLRDVVATLVLPNGRANAISENLFKAINTLLPAVPPVTNEIASSPEGVNEKVEFLGQGVRLPV